MTDEIPSDVDEIVKNIKRNPILEKLVADIDKNMNGGKVRFVLDDAAMSLAERWRDDICHNIHSREEFCKSQAQLIAAYDGCGDSLRNYHLAERHLEYIVAEPFLSSHGPCPVAALSAEEARLLRRLTLARALSIQAHLSYANRVRWGVYSSYHEYDDYVRAERRVRKALLICRRPRADCIKLLRELLRNSWVENNEKESRNGYYLDAICAIKKEDSPHSDESNIRNYVNDFYGWIEPDSPSLDENMAFQLLRWFYNNPDIVSLLELTMKCCIISMFPEVRKKIAKAHET
jgi:hypothetical protein